jgi:RNA-directed DNA polymerase
MIGREISIGGGIKGQIFVEHIFEEIISLPNLFSAWREFSRGKRSKVDVLIFEENLERNIFKLHDELGAGKYVHGSYENFYVRDPKLRLISKACVRDRLVHQAVFQVLYHIFDRKFAHDSYSCRIEKGNHAAVRRLNSFCHKVSDNFNQPAFALKCDVKKFFASIDRKILFEIIKRTVKDEKALTLIKTILLSFNPQEAIGLPLGNVTSQLFANIYLNELDWFIKRELKIKFYLRYCDDFIVLDKDKNNLLAIIPLLRIFLGEELKLKLHERKIIIRKLNQGMDFLGYVMLPHYSVLRTKTRNRAVRKIKIKKDKLKNGLISEDYFNNSLKSHLGMLKHCHGHKNKAKIAGYW